MMKSPKRTGSLLGALFIGISTFALLFLFSTPLVFSSSESTNATSTGTETQTIPSESWYSKIEMQWGGRFRVLGAISQYDGGTIYHAVQDDPYLDGNADFRLNNDTYFNPGTYFTVNYEAFLSAGDSIEAQNKLSALLPDTLPDDAIIVRSPVSDERRFVDLTHTISAGDNYILLHRLDRLSLTFERDWGLTRIGRQAVTWGNGFLFNPMDLFNPFAPTQIDRDYKIGDDMIFTQFPLKQTGDLQLLYVPRRNPETDNVEWDWSSLAGKGHFAYGTTEFDVMAASHYDDFVLGFGSTGYLGDTAWRFDTTYTFLSDLSEKESGQDGYLSVVANMDYSWIWGGKNYYGFVEFYFNGLGEENYSTAITNKALVERIVRGEIFTLGRAYLSASVRVELHPLFNVIFTSINNITDPSGIIQPYGVWDITQDLQLTAGGTLPWGGSGTEFGGFPIPETGFISKPPYGVFLWLTRYF
jgi:hypothetical protein